MKDTCPEEEISEEECWQSMNERDLYWLTCMDYGRDDFMVFLFRWVPVQERSRSLALVYSGMYTGSVLGLAAAPHLIEVLAHLLYVRHCLTVA